MAQQNWIYQEAAQQAQKPWVSPKIIQTWESKISSPHFNLRSQFGAQVYLFLFYLENKEIQQCIVLLKTPQKVFFSPDKPPSLRGQLKRGWARHSKVVAGGLTVPILRQAQSLSFKSRCWSAYLSTQTTSPIQAFPPFFPIFKPLGRYKNPSTGMWKSLPSAHPCTWLGCPV